MDRVEAAKVLSVLKAAYPNSFRNMSTADVDTTIALWAKMFANESYEDVSNAVYALIETREAGYSPTIGEVKGKMGGRTSMEFSPSFRKSVRDFLQGYEKYGPAVLTRKEEGAYLPPKKEVEETTVQEERG